MAKLSVQAIRALAKEIIGAHPGGIRYTPLVDRVLELNPETPKNTVHGSVWNLDTVFPNEISKPSRGLFVLASREAETAGTKQGTTEVVSESGKTFAEADFYQSFADWLKNDLDEATEIAPLGGAGMKTKWGTPEVIGVYKPLASNLIKFPLELIAGEVKIDPMQPIVAFGQAVAYRLFASKTYIAMPSTLTEADQSRLEALCMLFGVGLVLFELDTEKPNFSIRVRAQRFSPDMFYVNEFADRLRVFDAEIFEMLFR